jgi:putative component of membrane protein insertase Oxa1/YidC/SpoIIIJ protein YidD
MRRGLKAALLSLFGLSVYLSAEAIQPADRQLSARAGLAMLDAYQTTASPLLKTAGFRCRYTPSCSHYAGEAIAHYGTVEGILRGSGRLWLCSPWGGTGYDPAVRASATRTGLTQETSEERLDAQKIKKELKDSGKEIAKGCAVSGAMCGIFILISLVGFAIEVFLMVFAYKDAKARGDQNAVLWIVLIFFLPLIGFVVYLIARPKGDLSPCGNCHNRRMATLLKCPHCGAGGGADPATGTN